MRRSGLILHVIDSLNPAPDEVNLEPYHHATVFEIWNKSDRVKAEASPDSPYRKFFVSCLTGEGIEELKQAVIKWMEFDLPAEDPMLLESRHIFHLEEIINSLNRCEELWFQAPDEIIAIELDDALKHAGEITGTITHEEVLGRIFSVFCVGK